MHLQLGPLPDGRRVAEGHGLEDRFEVFSAGTEATRVRPEAISVMAEIGVDISAQESESLDRYLGETLDLVVTVCDDANEACPVFPGARERLHSVLPRPFESRRWPRRAPAGVSETCGMRSVPASKANWLNKTCDPNLAPSGGDISGRQTAIIGFAGATHTRSSETDLAMMRRALLAAEEAAEKGEVPVGAKPSP